MSNSPFRRMIEASAPDFWRLWYVGLIVATVRWLETIAVGIVVYQRTDSAFLVSMMTMLRLLPMGLFGVFLGALAERFDRGRTLLIVVLLMSGTSAVLAVLAWTGQLEIWHLALASFINGCGWSTDNPVRRVMIGEVVGREHMGTAMSLDVGANNASRMVGPAVGGFLLAGIGIEGAFILSVLMYCTALWAILTIRSRIPRAAGSGAVLARIAEGLALVRTDKRLIGALVVTVIYNIFAWPFTSMIPVIGRDRLLLGPEGVGLLATMDGIGAFVGALLLALWLTPEMVRPRLSWRRRLLPDHGGDFRAGAKPGAGGRGIAADGVGRRRICDDAGDPGLSRRAAGNALAHTGRPDRLHRHGPDRLPVAGLARRPHRLPQRHGRDRRSRLAGHGRDLALVEGDLRGLCSTPRARERNRGNADETQGCSAGGRRDAANDDRLPGPGWIPGSSDHHHQRLRPRRIDRYRGTSDDRTDVAQSRRQCPADRGKPRRRQRHDRQRLDDAPAGRRLLAADLGIVLLRHLAEHA